MRRGRYQHQVAVRSLCHEVAQQLMAQLLSPAGGGALRGGMGLVDDDELGARLDEALAPAIGLDEVDRDNRVRVLLEDRTVQREISAEPGRGAWPDPDRRQMEFLAELGDPLLAQVGRAQHT